MSTLSKKTSTYILSQEPFNFCTTPVLVILILYQSKKLKHAAHRCIQRRGDAQSHQIHKSLKPAKYLDRGEHCRDTQTVHAILRRPGSITHAHETPFENRRRPPFTLETIRDSRVVVLRGRDFIFSGRSTVYRGPVISRGYTKTLSTLFDALASRQLAREHACAPQLFVARPSRDSRVAFSPVTPIFRLTLVR